VIIHDCDVIQYFGSTMSKGKKNDYVSHNACLDCIFERYKREFRERGEELRSAKVWTDNCSNQYKCKENFSPIATIKDRQNLKLRHRFAIKDNFKGVWDAAGKVAKHFLSRLEKQGTRSPTTIACFKNLKEHGYEIDDREEWKQLEETRSTKLLKKKTFTVTQRIVGLAVEDQDEYKRLSQEYENIVFTNRDPTQVLTLKKPVPNTQKLHEVASCSEPVSNESNVYYLLTAHLPCSCIDCRISALMADGVCKECTYSTRTKAKKEHVVTMYKQIANGQVNVGEAENDDDVMTGMAVVPLPAHGSI